MAKCKIHKNDFLFLNFLAARRFEVGCSDIAMFRQVSDGYIKVVSHWHLYWSFSQGMKPCCCLDQISWMVVVRRKLNCIQKIGLTCAKRRRPYPIPSLLSLPFFFRHMKTDLHLHSFKTKTNNLLISFQLSTFIMLTLMKLLFNNYPMPCKLKQYGY